MIGQTVSQFVYIFITQIRYHRHGDVLRFVSPLRAQIAALNFPLGSLLRVENDDLIPFDVLIGHELAQRGRLADQVIDFALRVPAVSFDFRQCGVEVLQHA